MAASAQGANFNWVHALYIVHFFSYPVCPPPLPPKFPHAPGGPAAGLVAADTLYSAPRSTRETGIVCLAYSATSFGKPAAHFPSLLSVSRRGSPWSSLRSVQRPAGKEVEKKKKRRLSRYLNPRRAGNEPFY